MNYIGIHGPAGVGKTTLAEIFNAKTNCAIVPFARPLKEFAKQLGWNGIKDDNGRKILQLLGTDIGRNLIDPDIWIKHWETTVIELGREGERLFVADDLRFTNEAKIITMYHGTLIKMTGRGAYNPSNDLSKHASEQILPDYLFDCVIDNSGSIEELQEIADKIIKDEQILEG